MSTLEDALLRGFSFFTRGQLANARRVTAPFLTRHRNDPRLAALEGQVLLAQGEASAAVGFLRTALAAAPGHAQLTFKLALALVQSGASDEAQRIARLGQTADLRRIVAFIDQQKGDIPAAIVGYRSVVEIAPADHSSWHILALLHHRSHQMPGAREAIARAVALQPGQAKYRLVEAAIFADMGLFAERHQALVEGVTSNPDDASLWSELSIAAAAIDMFEMAQNAFEKAVTINPRLASAYRERAMVLDRLGRLDEWQALLDRARRAGVDEQDLAFPEALLFLRTRQPERADAVARTITAGVNEARLAQLRGDVADALGRYAEAFGAYVEMNRASAAEPLSAWARAMNYTGEVAATVDRLERDGSRWETVNVEQNPPEPVFVLGFPRSGTTLLDTLLRNLPSLAVFEEPPMLEHAALLLTRDDFARPRRATIEAARDAYFQCLQTFAPETVIAHRTIVDKFPLHLTRVSTIHRLFPGARIVFVERHPCDVILSCFFARFQNNKAMVVFQDLHETARLYDLAMRAWTLSEQAFDLNVHRLRYERLVTDKEKAMRGVLDFLGLDWNARVLDNERSAADRGLIATASFAQVTLPVHSRSVARWRHYEEYLRPILPILKPWIERMGYDG